MTSRKILSLPVITRDSSSWRLPLCDATALTLLEILAENTDQLRISRFCEALAIDPALAVWCVLKAVELSPPVGRANETANFPQTVAALAARLSPHLLQLLDWQDGTPLIEISADQHSRFAALVAESISAAQSALRSANRESAFVEPQYLASLTARWQEWLEVAGNYGVNSAGSPFVWPLETQTADSSLLPEARTVADEAWRRWLLEIPSVHALLQAMTLQLRRLLELEQNFDRNLQTTKLQSLKEFAYGAGHELNNPLANIASRAQTLLKEEIHPERRRRLAEINTQAFRAHEMLADMMLFAQPPQLVWEKVNLTALIQDVLSGLNDRAAVQQTTLHAPTRTEPLLIDADAAQLRTALRALCVNSLEAIHHGGNVIVEFCRCDAIEGAAAQSPNAIQIQVTDNGPGIAPEIYGKIFDPFFSGREAGRGLGFGLSKCWRIAILHGGHIDVQSSPGHGATFTITMPENRELNTPLARS